MPGYEDLGLEGSMVPEFWPGGHQGARRCKNMVVNRLNIFLLDSMEPFVEIIRTPFV